MKILIGLFKEYNFNIINYVIYRMEAQNYEEQVKYIPDSNRH